MATQSFLLQLQTAALDIPIPVCYGLVRGTGNKVAQVEAADKTIYAVYAHGIGPWNRIVRCWIDRKPVSLPSANVHFHEGGMGEIGSGMSATSTGGDQKVDAFFANFPGGTDFITYSGLAYTFIKRPPDPGAPSADPEFLADFEALLCRRFDNTGAQVAFDWTQNQVWWEVDKVIRAFIKREQKLTKTYAEPLLTAEKNRFDWALIKDAADYCDADIGGGVKRFSDGGVVWIQDGLTLDRALEQLHLMCRGFIQEINGKIAIRIKKNDSSAFTLKFDHIEPGSFKLRESRLFDLYNQVVPVFRDYSLASGSSDDATRFSEATPEPLNHESAQIYAGGRAPGLAAMPLVKPVLFDFGVNTPERVWRLSSSFLREELGEEADPGTVYKEPPEAEVVALEETLEIIPGDVITVDKGISEEHGGKDYRVREVVERPNGSRLLVLKRHNPNAYPDVAPAQQQTQAPAPGTGLAPITVVDSGGSQHVATGVKVGGTSGILSDRVNDALFDTGSQGRVKPARLHRGVGKKNVAGNLVTASYSGVTTGWQLVGTTTIDIPAGTATIVLDLLSPAPTGSGSIRLATTNNIGIAIYSGSPPASPDVNRTGSGEVTRDVSALSEGTYTVGLYFNVVSGTQSNLNNGAIRQDAYEYLQHSKVT